jgi:hypothetical protein
MEIVAAFEFIPERHILGKKIKYSYFADVKD